MQSQKEEAENVMKNMFSIKISQFSYSHSIGRTRSIVPDIRLTLDLSKWLFFYRPEYNFINSLKKVSWSFFLVLHLVYFCCSQACFNVSNNVML